VTPDLEHVIALGTQRLRLSVSSASDTGRVRTLNEDSVLVAPPLFVVADGMGGHAHGDQASAAAAAAFRDRFDPDRPAEVDEVIDAVHAANAAVTGLAREGGFSGTTLSGLALVRTGDALNWLAFNIGDSRIYRFGPSGLVQLSVDHSVVQELLTAGAIAPEDVGSHPERNVVTRALGASAEVDPDVWLLPVEQGDAFVICSDGLSKELDDREITRLIDGHGRGASLADLLVRAANAAGGHDNITVVVLTTELIGADGEIADETRDRLPRALEETNPRI
jgi:serine/threonine protein phosphatase PrpC